jgi:hypothetical protein
MWDKEDSWASRVTSRYRSVSTQYIGFVKSGLAWALVAAKHGQLERKEIQDKKVITFNVWPYGHQFYQANLKIPAE